MTIIERLENEIKTQQYKIGYPNVVVDRKDLSALLKCVRALHAFVHTQANSYAEINVLTARRIEAERKVGLG